MAFSGFVAVAQMGLGLFLKLHVSAREDGTSQKPHQQEGDEESEGTSSISIFYHPDRIHDSLILTFTSFLEAPLLSPSARKDKPATPFTISQVLANPAIRPQVLLVAFILAAQQFSGIKSVSVESSLTGLGTSADPTLNRLPINSAVMFYSTPVMKPLMPDKAGLIGIGLAVLNSVMTVPPMILVDVSPLLGSTTFSS